MKPAEVILSKVEFHSALTWLGRSWIGASTYLIHDIYAFYLAKHTLQVMERAA